MSITARDESTHEKGADKHWNESFYVNFFDREGGWGGVTRIGLSPNQGKADGLVCLYFPDGSFALTVEESPLRAFVSPGQELLAGALRHDCTEPCRSWRVRYAGKLRRFATGAALDAAALLGRAALEAAPAVDVEFDLAFDGYHEPFDYHMRQSRLPLDEVLRGLTPSRALAALRNAPLKVRQGMKMRGARHYEQAGRVTGKLVVEGASMNFRGSGQRDHSWGVRDWKVPTRWRWFVCQFGEEFAFNAARVELLGFQAVGGYVWHRGHCSPLRDWTLESTLDATGLGGRDLGLVLHTKSGETFSVSGEVLVNIPLRNQERRFVTVVNEGRARFRWRDQVGYGVSEFLEQR